MIYSQQYDLNIIKDLEKLVTRGLETEAKIVKVGKIHEKEEKKKNFANEVRTEGKTDRCFFFI